MDNSGISSRLDFLGKAERLKDTLRSAHTTSGRTESVAEHIWRLTLLAVTFADEFPDIDLLELLKICILHDLGEAIDGDIPAPLQSPTASKSGKALDKLETILQHNQGMNPDDFDYEFNLEYGKAHTNRVPIAATIRNLLDVETRARASQSMRRGRSL